jgi:hypothetical protein
MSYGTEEFVIVSSNLVSNHISPPPPKKKNLSVAILGLTTMFRTGCSCPDSFLFPSSIIAPVVDKYGRYLYGEGVAYTGGFRYAN